MKRCAIVGGRWEDGEAATGASHSVGSLGMIEGSQAAFEDGEEVGGRDDLNGRHTLRTLTGWLSMKWSCRVE